MLSIWTNLKFRHLVNSYKNDIVKGNRSDGSINFTNINKSTCTKFQNSLCFFCALECFVYNTGNTNDDACRKCLLKPLDVN